tara:strand:+ start:4354 stop:4545 length:192 start_codon:yes stop_codon:yes gene_type:complete
MTVGETIKMLDKSENYLKDRLTISDEFINMVKTMMPYDYERIQEKEEHYLSLVSRLRDGLNGA